MGCADKNINVEKVVKEVVHQPNFNGVMQSNLNVLSGANSIELNRRTMLSTIMQLSVQKHKRGCILTANNTKYSNTIFTDNETILLKDIMIQLVLTYIMTANNTEKQCLENLICPACEQKTFSLANNKWVCSNCGYAINHYEVIKNDKK